MSGECLQSYGPREGRFNGSSWNYVADVVGSSPGKEIWRMGRTSIGQECEAKCQLNVELN